MNQGWRLAVLIGNGNFGISSGLRALRCPPRDVEGMREILAGPDLGGFVDVDIFTDSENHLALHGIGEMLGDAEPHDQVLIYYSGHGQTDLPGRLYLATANTSKRNLVATSIPLETVRL